MIQTDLVGFQVTDEEVVPDSVIGQRGSFRHLSGDVSQMTVQLCVLRCWNQRFTFAGIQDSKRCYCANTIIRMTKVLDENCNKRCLGNCKQRCGGLLALSTYETGYEKEPDQLVDNVRFHHYGFKGCYEFNEAAMCFDGNDHSKAYLPEMVSGRMKPQFCVAYCLSKGLKYAILKSTSSCCCGWTFPDQLQPMTSRDPCNIPCVGAPEPFCVGQEGVTHYVTVYFTQDLETKAKFPRMNTVTLLTNGWILPQFSDNVNFEVEGPSPDVIKYLRSRSADKRKETDKLLIL
ncbi:WSC domain-containing protein ARB_07867-like isoform X2 [Pomacea canaliculata]|nr:WSC domain-containing protein ARB_07867-like isoform X2 [Pomacea canaliculata]